LYFNAAGVPFLARRSYAGGWRRQRRRSAIQERRWYKKPSGHAQS
jgi:hypothetical protein